MGTADSPPAPRRYVAGGMAMTARPIDPGLHLVATPIGNLGDMTLRGLETLAAADVIACEDTRVTRVLLDRYGIAARPYPYHQHNEADAGPKLMAALQAGKSVALVSDAGTPSVSDPGFRLAGQAIAAGIRVIPVPGASAVLAALVGSGLATDTFLFGGFLPAKDQARKARLAELAMVPATLVFFESPQRIAVSLAGMADILGGERQAVVARELTKTFEEFRRGSLAELAFHYKETAKPKGEIVVCIAPPLPRAAMDAVDIDALLAGLAAEMPASKAAAEAARLSGRPKTELYQRLLALKDKA